MPTRTRFRQEKQKTDFFPPRLRVCHCKKSEMFRSHLLTIQINYSPFKQIEREPNIDYRLRVEIRDV